MGAGATRGRGDDAGRVGTEQAGKQVSKQAIWTGRSLGPNQSQRSAKSANAGRDGESRFWTRKRLWMPTF